MDERKSSPLVPWLVAVAIIVCLGAIYAGAYFGLSTRTTTNLTDGGKLRIYRTFWMAIVFVPAAIVEAEITGTNVSPGCPMPAAAPK